MKKKHDMLKVRFKVYYTMKKMCDPIFFKTRITLSATFKQHDGLRVPRRSMRAVNLMSYLSHPIKAVMRRAAKPHTHSNSVPAFCPDANSTGLP